MDDGMNQSVSLELSMTCCAVAPVVVETTIGRVEFKATWCRMADYLHSV